MSSYVLDNHTFLNLQRTFAIEIEHLGTPRRRGGSPPGSRYREPVSEALRHVPGSADTNSLHCRSGSYLLSSLVQQEVAH
jgi:hypothetical protein